jgi:uncharacterized protein
MPRVTHFEIPADDPERAIRFYSRALGWSFHKWEGPVDYWMITTGPDDQAGINGGLYRRGEMAELVNVADVADLDATVAAVTGAGGQIVAPRMAVPGIGHVAYVRDTEGTLLGLMQADPTA